MLNRRWWVGWLRRPGAPHYDGGGDSVGRAGFGPTTARTLSGWDIDEAELRGFSRSFAEVEWLLIILVLAWLLLPWSVPEQQPQLLLGLAVYAAVVMGFRYFNFYLPQRRWKLFFEALVMTAFVTWVLGHTGGAGSPLAFLYILVVITAGLTLGRWMSFAVLLLVGLCYLAMGAEVFATVLPDLEGFSHLMARFAPFLLVAYLVALLSADLQSTTRRFRQLSEVDELTGLFNLRAFQAALDREATRSIRYGHAFSIMMVDADNLKQVNDRYGHPAGDRLLQLVAGAIVGCLRVSDVLARYGGDEFIVLLPETDRERATVVAERIRAAIHGTVLSTADGELAITVSIGLASYPEDAGEVAEVLERADKAMYRSKQRGRNQVSRGPAPQQDAVT